MVSLFIVVARVNDEVIPRWAGLVLRCNTVREYTVLAFNQASATQANSAWPSLRG